MAALVVAEAAEEVAGAAADERERERERGSDSVSAGHLMVSR